MIILLTIRIRTITITTTPAMMEMATAIERLKERKTIEFKKLEKTDKPLFDKFYRAGYYENAYASFTGLYMWRELGKTQWALDEDVIYLVAEWNGKFSAFQPIGSVDKMQSAITKVIQMFGECGQDVKLVGLEKFFVEELAKYPDATFEITSDRNNSDYVYLAQDLINLSGRKFHGKKNHLNQFYKDYPTAEYLPITAEIIPQCREVLNQWYEVHRAENPEDVFLCYEQAAIHEIFDNFCEFNLKGGAILLGGKIVAFTFGEQLNSDTAVIHVEKADPSIRGAYTAINHDFVAQEWSAMTYINREEDMGLEGLRQAKESYRPVKMIDKFNAHLIEKG